MTVAFYGPEWIWNLRFLSIQVYVVCDSIVNSRIGMREKLFPAEEGFGLILVKNNKALLHCPDDKPGHNSFSIMLHFYLAVVNIRKLETAKK